jgi:hypothetical protein
MSAFFERNKPVFVIGLITLSLFLGIILFYALKPHGDLTVMKLVGSDSSPGVPESEIVQQSSDSAQLTVQSGTEMGAALEIIKVKFTDLGWVPKIVDVAKDQKVVWKNETSREIFLRQRTPSYDMITDTIKIEPGKSFELKMTVVGDWNYDESQSRLFATIRVFEISQ